MFRPRATGKPKSQDSIEFLKKDYELRVSYLTNHFTRMWTRFNFFLSIESALFAFSLGKDNFSYVWLVSATGIMLSIAWYYFGATDNYLVDVYRKQIGHTYYLLIKYLGPDFIKEMSNEEREVYSFVGDIHDLYFDPASGKAKGIEQNFLQGRSKRISITELAVIFAVLFLFIWLIRFGAWVILLPR
jgi:hypothetical protein